MECIWASCTIDAVPNSKYCSVHKITAKNIFLQMIADEKKEKEIRYDHYKRAYDSAYDAASIAGQRIVPVPMIVEQHTDVLDDNSEVVNSYIVPQGICGFATVYVKPGNCKLANWLKKEKKWQYDDYSHRVGYHVFEFGQSYERKCAFASKFAKVFFQLLQEFNVDYIKNIRIGTSNRLD